MRLDCIADLLGMVFELVINALGKLVEIDGLIVVFGVSLCKSKDRCSGNPLLCITGMFRKASGRRKSNFCRYLVRVEFTSEAEVNVAI